MKRCWRLRGSSMERVVKLNVYCTAEATHFAKFNEVYARYFAIEIPGTDLPACSFPGRDRSISRSIASRSCKRLRGDSAHSRAGVAENEGSMKRVLLRLQNWDQTPTALLP